MNRPQVQEKCAIGGENLEPRKAVNLDGKKLCIRHYEKFSDWAYERFRKSRVTIKFEDYLKSLSLDDYLDHAEQEKIWLSKLTKTILIIVAVAFGISLLFLGEEIKTAEALFRSLGRILAILRFGAIGLVIAVVALFLGWYLWKEWKVKR